MADNKTISIKITADSKVAEKGLRNMTDELKATASTTEKMSGRMNKSAVALEKIAKQLDHLTNDIKNVRKNVDKIDPTPVKDVGEALEHTTQQAKKASSGIKGFTGKLERLSTAVSTMAAVQLGSVISSAATGLIGLGVSAVQAAAQMRQYEIAFQTMLKSTSEGTKMLQELQQFAANTPFDVPGVVSAGQQLMAFGFKASEIIPMLRSLGDAASGLGQGTAGVSRLAYALGQMRTSGKLNAQDMMQLTSAGIAAWDMLAQAAGKSVAEIKDLTSKGMIDSKEAVKIIVAGMNSEFGGMMEKTADEVTGLLANIEETVGNTSATVGKYMIEAFDIKGALKNISDALGEFQQKMQTASSEGKTFTDVLKECVPASVIIALGSVVTVLGAVAVAAAGAMAAAIGLSGAVVAGAVAIGAAITSVVVYWDEICDAIKVGINAILDLVVMTGTAIVQAVLGVVAQIAGAFGSLWEGVTDDHNNWFNSLKSMLSNAVSVVADFARKAISYFDEVFAASSNTMKRLSTKNTNGDGELAQIKQDYQTWEDGKKKTDSTSGSLIMSAAPKSTNKATKTENVALKELQEANKLKQERLRIESEYTKQKLKKEKDLFNAQMAMTKKYGTDEQKLAVSLKEIELNKKQELAREELSFKEQLLATESAMKEAVLKGANQEEIDTLNRKLQLLKEIHAYTVDDIQQSAANSKANANHEYSVAQTQWQAQYDNASTVGQMTMANNKWKDEATSGVNSNTQLDETQRLEQLKEINKQYEDQQAKISAINSLQQVGVGVAKSFSSAIANWVTGAESFGGAMKNMLSNLIAQLIQAVVYATILAALGFGGGSTFGARFSSNFSKGFASGGAVNGPGTGTSDSIPAMLSNGEYVLNANAVERLGVPFLNGLNSGRLPAFATGGLVVGGGGSSGRSQASTASSSQSLTLNVSALDASSFVDFLANGGLRAIKQASLDDSRNFNTSFGMF